MIFLYGFFAWFLLMITAVINGAFREAYLIPTLGEGVGRFISTLILCALLIIEIVIFLAIAGDDESGGTLLGLGAMWLAKPWTRESLQELVKPLLAAQRPLAKAG